MSSPTAEFQPGSDEQENGICLSQEWEQFLIEEIEKYTRGVSSPIALALDVGHLSVQPTVEERRWASQNILFSDRITHKLISLYGKRFRFIPFVLVNDLAGRAQQKHYVELVCDISCNASILTAGKLKIVHERTLRNRAATTLNHSDNLKLVSDRAFLDSDNAVCDIAVGNVNEEGRIVPRCPAILFEYWEKLHWFASQRLHTYDNPNVLILSFARGEVEVAQSILGIEAMMCARKCCNVQALIVEWIPWSRMVVHSYQNKQKSWFTVAT